MNPNESDAGPPHKKPKILAQTSHSNGLNTQLSESTEITAIENLLPDDLLADTFNGNQQQTQQSQYVNQTSINMYSNATNTATATTVNLNPNAQTIHIINNQQPINHINNKMPSSFNVQQPIQPQQQTYQIKTSAVQQPQANMLKTGANSTIQAPQQSATSAAANQNSALNTTFHNVGNVNINNINIMVQPNNPATNLNGTNAPRFQSPVNNTTANIITNPTNANVLNRNQSGILPGGSTIVTNNVGVTVANNPNTIIINNTNRNLPNLANSTNSTNSTITNANRPPSQTQYDLNSNNLYNSNMIKFNFKIHTNLKDRQINGPAQVQSQQAPVIVQTGQITNIQATQAQQQQQVRAQALTVNNNKQAQQTQNVLVNSTTNNTNSTNYPVVNHQQYSNNQVINLNGPSINPNQIMVNNNSNNNPNSTTIANTAINIPTTMNTSNNMTKQVVVNTHPNANPNTNAPTNTTNVVNANTNANNMRNNSSNPVNEQEKRKLIQQQLILLLHAHKCAQRADRQCNVPHCSTMREVLAHMVHCTQGRNCEMTHCASSRQIIAHWKNCQRPECPVCQPLRNSNQQTPALPNSLASNNTTNTNNTTTSTTTNSNDLPIISNASSNQNTTNSTANSNNTFNNHPNTTQTNQSQPSASVLLLQQPQQPRVHKPWHENINAEMRRHLVQKIIQTIFPTSDPNIYGDPRLSNLINYATKTEREMYEQAQDQEEYFHLLAERIYKIQKEFEDKQRAARTNNALHNNNNNLLNSNSNSLTNPNGDLLSSNESSMSRLNDLSQFQNPLNPLNPYNPDLSAGNEGPPNRLAPISDSPLKVSARSVDARAAQSNTNQQAMNKSNSLTSLNNFQSNSVISSSTSSSNINKSELELKNEIKSELAIKNEPNNFNENIKNEPKSESISPNKYLIKSEPIDASSSSQSSTSANNTGTTNGQLNTSSSTSNLNGPSSISPSKATSSTSASSSSSSSNSTTTQEPQNVIATTTKGANNKPIIKFPSEYLIEKLMPILDRMYKEPDSLPFHVPVNPEELGLPDYFNVVKKPMDMSTIKKKLEEGKYSNPQEFVDDTWLMFNNAWLYNKKTSRVYKSCTKLSEVFSSCIDSVMKEMGYCCGQQFTFMPQVMFCYGNQMCCTIPRDGVYYLYNNTDQGRANVNCDKYTYCLKCFEGIKNETVPIGDDPSQPLVEVKKSLFVQMKNDHEEPEQYAECTECGRKWHQICALHMEQIFCKFVCDTCLREKKALAKKDNRYTSSKLQRTQLGDFLENRVNDFLKHSAGGDKAGRVTIRILSSVDKICEVKQNIKARFEGEITETFPFKTKAIFAFEEIDGTDVVFFGMHVQEYGSECAPPNTRRVYISYLDSVFFFRPKELRTAVYHEILIGYLDYVKRMGYQWAHIWACPPSEGDDYIFHCHPPEQKVPKPKRLQEWYRKMLDKGVIERVVIDYKDIHKDAIENGMKTPLDIPYFEGDFWPNVLEECIKESEQEEEKRRKEEAEAAMAAANEDFSTCGEDIYESNESSKDNSNSNGKKKNINSQQKKKNIKNKMSQRKSVKKVGSSSTDLMTKILSTMEKHKEVFFVIRLLDTKQVAQMGSIMDRDPLISCDLMNGRDEFLNFARDKHHEFSTLRRAKYSTMALLYELHNQASEKFTYTCNKCKMQMEVRYHCTVCEDFDLCVTCYETRGGHEHRMERLAGASSQDSDMSNEAKQQNQQDFKGDKSNMKPQKAHIEIYLKTFMHAINCRNANCTYAKCSQFKRIVQHSKQCPKIKNSQCDFCRQLLALCIYHAKSCKEDQCTVPFCSQIKLKLKQQKAFNSQAERRRMIMMNKTLRQSANVNLNADSPKEENASNGPANPNQLAVNQNQMMMNQSGPHSHQMIHSMSTNNMSNGQHVNMMNVGHHPQQQQQQQQHPLMHTQSQPQMNHYPTQPTAVQINLPSTNHHMINNNSSYQNQQPQPQQMHQYPIKQQPQMVNNPPQISNSSQTNFNQNTFVNNSQINSQLVYSQQQQQQPQQSQTLLNSPNKQTSHMINRNIGINQQQQQQPTANQQLQQQQQSPQNFAQNTRIMNSSITSPHPAPTTTPNSMNYNDMNSSQGVDTANSWQANQQYVVQNRNMQVAGSTGSPMTMTASPSPMQPMQQNQAVYQQQVQQPTQQQQAQPYGQAQSIQQPQQQGMNNPGMDNLIARLRQAQTQAERNQILQEINAINPAFYQRLQQHQQQKQQQMMLNQQQQQQQPQPPPQVNSNTMNITQQPQAQQQQQWNHVYQNNATQQQQYINNPQQPQQQQQIRYNAPTMQQQQQPQPQPGVNRQVIINQPQQVVVQPQQNAQMVQQQRIGQGQPIQTQQLTPQQIQQQQQLNQQKLYQQRMMQHQQQQNMMNPSIRPQQPGQQQTMYMQQVQQPQQQMMNYKDAQMINQTKDQMLLQAPNQFMSSPQNPQNPTDKLSQVVDNL